MLVYKRYSAREKQKITVVLIYLRIALIIFSPTSFLNIFKMMRYFYQRTTMTGQGALPTIALATLPSKSRLNPVRPLDPTTIRSIAFSLA